MKSPWLITCYLLFLCGILHSAEAKWEFPEGLVPKINIRVPLKIYNLNENISKWDPPLVSGLQWLGIQRGGHFTQIINGVRTQEQTIFVTVNFEKEGEYKIPAITFSTDSGASVSTEAQTLNVSTATFNADGDCFAEASLNPSQIVPGQQFTLHYSIGLRLNKRLAINNQLGIQLPDECIRIGEVHAAKARVQYASNGDIWQITDYTIDFKLTKPGSYVFGGQQSYGQLQERVFNNFYHEIGTMPIKPATLTVLELPRTGQPAHFAGLIGSVDLNASVDRDRIALGKNIVLQIVASNGQIDMLSNIKLPNIEGITAYASDPETNAENTQRTYSWTLVPKREGNFLIPAIDVPYFDPSSMTYRSVSTKPISLSVIPGASRELGMVGSINQPTHSTQELASNAGLLLPSPLYGQARASWPHSSNWFALLIGFFAGLVIALVGWSLQHRDKRGQLIKKSVLQALSSADLGCANQQLHLLIPFLNETDRQAAQQILNAVEQARFGKQKLDPQLVQSAKQWKIVR